MSEGAADEKQTIPNQVFVGGMTPETSIEQLTKHFSSLKLNPAGSPTFFLNPQGASKGCALIPFASADDAKAAVAALEGSDLGGQKLRAREDRGPRKPRRREQVNQDNTYVYVGNLDPAITSEELETLFAPFGKTQFVSISRKRRSETALGWATVQMSSEEEAQKAIEGLNGKTHNDRALTVEILRSVPRKARVRKEREPRDPTLPGLENAEPDVPVDPTIVWVGNLAWGTTEEALQKLFSQHGEVKDVVVTRQKRSNASRGWGTVTFATAEQAAAAVEALNGTSLEERDIEVQIRRGPRRRRRAPREPRETNDDNTNANTEQRPRRARRRRQPRPQNTDDEQGNNNNNNQGNNQGNNNNNNQRSNQRPRRQENKQGNNNNNNEGGNTNDDGGKRRRRARQPRNDSQRNDDNNNQNNADQNNNADGEGKNNRRRRRRQRKADNADGTEGDNNEDQQERRPRAERKEPVQVVVDFPDRHIYVRNLPWEVTDEELKQLFSQSGTVASATVTMNTKGTSRGWGTVEMSSAEEATKALGLDKQTFKNRPLIVRMDKRVTARAE